ncbi:FAD/NAD(P)-binding domain-containing protein [Laetiporus sulphureus 93-53]|uniref:FAD/NAD(P)-binding domain-containing protein n=1 Tax=Laetiporus sulphureus 93-53 TaxID=1314785 RepID=A0A165BEG3_9APHY|nr:FAD/NAD(P)-binding domain-containing protein [Laetiporus sulphureus 93-53]KZT00877.1 FAD/NAD(P)-binding domain-containing protein [Laetiporus sulphureus 93-53]
MAAAVAPLMPAFTTFDKLDAPLQPIVDAQKAVHGTDTLKPTLPTLDRLGASVPDSDIDVEKIASEWFKSFTDYVLAGDVDGIMGLFLDDGWWRDLLALTWEFRTFHGVSKIKKFLQDQLPVMKLSLLKLRDGNTVLRTPYPDLAWIQAFFDFDTEVGIGLGIFRLVPTADGTWKAFTMYTNLEDLKGFPEKIGFNREFLPNHGKWKDQRERERSFADGDPQVIVIGGGQSGLDVAARLKHLDVPTLVIERQNRIGDQWRTRYEALCLHDPVWYDHLPYMPFPPSWPVYTPAQKLANWLEYYAEAMELNVWTSSEVSNVRKDDDGKWSVTVRKGDGTERTFHVDHVIMAVGFGGGVPKVPDIPGRDEFQGQVLHSTEHRSAKDHLGKKVVIVGACTSAHDIAADYAEHGVDVTLFQRSATYVMSTKEGMPRLFRDLYWEGAGPVEVADRVHTSMPVFMMKEMHKRLTKEIAQADKNILDGLQKVGFRTHFGDDGSGFLYSAMTRGGGYYLDVGTCKKIINGEIKIKNDAQIERFTKNGLRFTNGTELECDVVLYATGFDGAQKAIDRLVGPELASQVSPIWNLNHEGEQRGSWRWLGVPNLWFMTGNLSMCRFHSKHLALQIKAIQEGIHGKRYAP